MTEHDIQRVEALFQEAADLPAAEREDFLGAACGDDLGLRDHVAALLARLDDNATMTSPVAPGGGPFLRAAITEGPGAVIDRYKLLQVIGEGGFGVVYMAEQQEPVVRKVALKIIKLGMDTREVVARFEAERQALAMMDHPNIARVLDGGATSSGRPYFVMELVRGVSITEYCDTNELTTHERLELFARICHAVQHAHQKGVIHRDLKPSNVMVTLHDGAPMPKIIDFGVAKAMHTRLTEKTLFTRFEQFIGTPAYMSPEQAQMSALDVDTRTDIYALGVLLYELLTGTTPFDTKSLLEAGIGEIQRVIREEHPPRPSLRISTTGDAAIARHRRQDVAGLTRVLKGDLDWIVMKALEKERGRRYATASEFADDVNRHLRNEPVTAGAPGAAYRARKFLARNRTAVVFGTLIALALFGGIIGTTFAMIRAERSAFRAAEETARAESALDFLISTLALTDRGVALDPDVTVRTLLDQSSATVSEALSGLPAAEARVRATIGLGYHSLSEEELAEAHLKRAVEIIDELPRASDGSAEGVDDGDFYTTLWALTNVMFNLERQDAFAISQRARRVGMRHIGRSHPRLAEALDRFAEVVLVNAWSTEPGAMDEAPALFAAARQMAEATLEPGDPLWEIVADTFLAAGYTVWGTSHEPRGEQYWGYVLDIQRRELPPEHPDIATTVRLLTDVLNKLGRAAESEALIRASVDALRQVHRADDFPVALAESTLGENLVLQGKYHEAEPLLLESHAIIARTVGSTTHWMAQESLVRVIELYDAWERHADGAAYRVELAESCATTRHPSQWDALRPAFGPEHDGLVELLDAVNEQCGGVGYSAGPSERAAPKLRAPLEAALALRAQTLTDPDDPRATALGRLLLGWANAIDPGRHVDERERMAREALTLLSPHEAVRPTDVAEAHALLAETAKDTDAGRRHARAAADLLAGRGDGDRAFETTAEIRIARALVKHEMYVEAERLLVPGHEALVVQLGPGHGDTRLARRLIHDLYVAWDRPADADRFAEGAEHRGGGGRGVD